MQEFYHTNQPSQPRKLRNKLFPPAKPGHKFCRDCKEEKPFDAFHKMSGVSDGYRPICKECRKIRSQQPKTPTQPSLFVLSKICIQCGQEKAIEDFNKFAQTRDGYHSVCRQCQSDYNRQHRIDHIEEYRIRAHIKNTRPETKARKMERHRERSVTDPQYLEMRKRYRKRNYQNHKDTARNYVQRRRARILNATIDTVSYAHILERDGWICYICDSPIDPNARKRSAQSLTFDHVIPLHPRLGDPQGTHSEDNLRPAHHACNVRKGNRPLETLTEHDRRGPC